MNNSPFLERLREHIKRDELLPTKATIVVGVSGGVDSTVLLHALHRISRLDGAMYDLHVAHFDHQLRGEESTGDAAFVASLSDELGLRNTIERCNVRAIDARDSGSREDIARRERFAFFERVSDSIGATHIALAHHADDQIETVLHRFLRGTGIRGLAGMAVRRPLSASSDVMVVKPLLHFTRQEIIDFASAQDIAYREDSSNQSTDHTRNRIRHDLIPHLEKTFNPRIRDAILRLSQQCQWTNAFVRECAAKALRDATRGSDGSSITLNRSGLADQPKIIKATMLRLAIESLGTRERRLTFKHIKEMLDAVEGDGTKWRLALPDGVDVQIIKDKIVISRDAK